MSSTTIYSSLLERIKEKIKKDRKNFAILTKALEENDCFTAEKIINKLNAYSLKESEINNLTLAPLFFLDTFITEKEKYFKFYKKAQQLFINGEYVPEFFFAGAATRMKRGTMWGMDFWEIAKDNGVLPPPYALSGIGLGPRQLFQYKIKLITLAKNFSKSTEEVLANQKIVLHINDQIEREVVKFLQQTKFLGFLPQNIILLVQPCLPLFSIEDSEIKVAPPSLNLPAGHGYATEQLAKPREAYTIVDGKKVVINSSVLNYLLKNNAKIMGTHRINDLTRLGDEIVNLNKLAFSLYLIEKGYNIIVELVENPTGQKGGVFLKDKRNNKVFLLEGLNTNTPLLEKKLGELTSEIQKQGFNGIPYNAFRHIYNILELKKLLKNKLPASIRIRKCINNKIYLQIELVTGDITRENSAKVAGFMKKGEFIKDFKQIEDINIGEKFIKEQDNNKQFRRLVTLINY